MNKYLYNLIVQMSKVLETEVGIIEDGGTVTSSVQTSNIENYTTDIIDICSESNKRVNTLNGYSFAAAQTRGKVDYAVFIKNDGSDCTKHVEMLLSAVANLKVMHSDKFDKNNFIKNILSDSVLPSDVFVKSKEFHIEYEKKRIVYVLKYSDNKGIDVFDIVSSLFPDNGKDFVIDLDNNTIVIVNEIVQNSNESYKAVANQIIDTVIAEAMTDAKIGIGTIANNIRDIAKSYKEARIALEVGKVFDDNKRLISYDNLGIARLIYQLPTTLCEMFLSEVFKKGTIEDLDAETLYTINQFFENNLNISETSRQLYVHRNTLVYRLDKVKKITGLDLRIFEHAIVFKIALMVKKYLTTKPMRI